MKKAIAIIFTVICSVLISCNAVSKIGGYLLNEKDAVSAIKELLSNGTNHGTSLLGIKGAFSKENIMRAVFPPEIEKVVSTLNQLGLGNEVTRFTSTLGTCAEKTALSSAPVFLLGIKKMNIGDAIGIVKNGGTACTDYLKRTIGDSLRRAIAPGMQLVLDEYKIGRQWDDLVAPAKLFLGNKLNLDLSNLMAGLVSNMIFSKIAEKEREIRTRQEARTSSLLQNVFGKDWSTVKGTGN
jgi:hypothetical protein